MCKTSNPGLLQVRRFFNKKRYIGDAIYNTEAAPQNKDWIITDPLDPTKKKVLELKENYRDLLIPVFRNGKCIYKAPSLEETKKKVEQELSFFHQGLKRFIYPHQYPHGLEMSLYENKIDLIEKVRTKHDQCTNHC